MSREITSLALPPLLRTKLIRAGFRFVEDFANIRPQQLAQEAGISPDQALQVIKAAAGQNNNNSSVGDDGSSTRPSSQSCLDLLENKISQKIFSFSDELDRILGGGVPLGDVTEFCGPPGIGKTQLGLQFCVDTTLPANFGGLGGDAVFIDTEGSFMIERVTDIATAFSNHVKKMARKSTQDASLVSKIEREVAVEGILNRIYLFRIYDFVEQLALAYTLPLFLAKHPNVRLVVLDSVTFHFRHDFEDFSQRSRLLVSHAQQLQNIAKRHNVAMVLMNQVTTKIGQGGQSYLAPALGESWGHTCSHRILVSSNGNGTRTAHLYKSPCYPPSNANFMITHSGIRSVNRNRANVNNNNNTNNNNNNGGAAAAVGNNNYNNSNNEEERKRKSNESFSTGGAEKRSVQ